MFACMGKVAIGRSLIDMIMSGTNSRVKALQADQNLSTLQPDQKISADQVNSAL